MFFFCVTDFALLVSLNDVALQFVLVVYDYDEILVFAMDCVERKRIYLCLSTVLTIIWIVICYKT